MHDALDASDRAGDLQPLLGPGGLRPSAQRARRRAGPAAGQRRDLHDHLRAVLRQPGRLRLGAGGQGRGGGGRGRPAGPGRDGRVLRRLPDRRAPRPRWTTWSPTWSTPARSPASTTSGLGGDYDGVPVTAGRPGGRVRLSRGCWTRCAAGTGPPTDLRQLTQGNISRVLHDAEAWPAIARRSRRRSPRSRGRTGERAARGRRPGTPPTPSGPRPAGRTGCTCWPAPRRTRGRRSRPWSGRSAGRPACRSG